MIVPHIDGWSEQVLTIQDVDMKYDEFYGFGGVTEDIIVLDREEDIRYEERLYYLSECGDMLVILLTGKLL